MAVATAAIIAGGTALAGLGLNIAQMSKANKAAKAAGEAGAVADQNMKGIKEQNAVAAVQVPTLGFEMAQQGIDRSTQAALGAVQGAGAEGVIGGVGQIMGATSEAEMNLAAQAGEAKLQRDMAQAQVGAGIEERRALREKDIYSDELTGAQKAKAAAATAKANAIEGAGTTLGSAIESFGGIAGAAYGFGLDKPGGTSA
jgi:hypothetical protein